MTGAIAITGAGLDLPTGESLSDLLDLVLEGKTPLERATRSGAPSAAVVGYPGQDPATGFAMAAAVEAMGGAEDAFPRHLVGVMVASTTSNIDTIARVAAGVASESYRAVRPAEVLAIAGTQVTASLSSWFDARAFAYGTCTGNAAGLDALAIAATSLRRGRASRVLIVGTESPGDATESLILEAEGKRSLFSGGVALVLDGTTTAENAAAIGRIDHAEGIQQLLTKIGILDPSPGIIFVPAGTGTERAAAARSVSEEWPEAQIVDVASVLGDVQGALGVLQCALAVTWLERHPQRPALMIAGSLTDRHLLFTVVSVGNG